MRVAEKLVSQVDTVELEGWTACTCDVQPYAHIHSDSGPPVNCDLEGADVFDVLKQLVRTK